MRLASVLREVRFQSAPGHEARGNATARPRGHRSCEVSIRPRPRGQGKPVTGHRRNPPRDRETVRRQRRRFQSAPGHEARGNRDRRHRAYASTQRVSIRPRPRGQGKPAQPFMQWQGTRGTSMSFNPPPATRPGETHRRRHTIASSGPMFQSAPGHEARGNAIPVTHMELLTFVFQSAPGHEARGNTVSGYRAGNHRSTFQSAPGHEARGNRGVGAGKSRDTVVSIRPRPRGQGKRRRLGAAALTSTMQFQSAPGHEARGNRRPGKWRRDKHLQAAFRGPTRHIVLLRRACSMKITHLLC